jgi:hypothetical protein
MFFTQKVQIKRLYVTDFATKLPRHVGSFRYPYNFVAKSVEPVEILTQIVEMDVC